MAARALCSNAGAHCFSSSVMERAMAEAILTQALAITALVRADFTVSPGLKLHLLVGVTRTPSAPRWCAVGAQVQHSNGAQRTHCHLVHRSTLPEHNRYFVDPFQRGLLQGEA